LVVQKKAGADKVKKSRGVIRKPRGKKNGNVKLKFYLKGRSIQYW
jgi:hypothetical protein